MEINVDEFVKQLYQEKIKFLIAGLVAIEEQLEKLKLEKFSYPIRAIVIALSIEELDMSKGVMKASDEKTQELAKDLLSFKPSGSKKERQLKNLEIYRGKTISKTDFYKIFEYSPSTWIHDTWLSQEELIKVVGKNKIKIIGKVKEDVKDDKTKKRKN